MRLSLGFGVILRDAWVATDHLAGLSAVAGSPVYMRELIEQLVREGVLNKTDGAYIAAATSRR